MMHILRKPDVFDYLGFAWNLLCGLSAVALVLGVAAVGLYLSIGCFIAEVWR